MTEISCLDPFTLQNAASEVKHLSLFADTFLLLKTSQLSLQ